MKRKKYIIGTRGSQLSLIQTNLVKDQLITLFPAIEFEIRIIKTTGDKNMKPIPLDSVGKGWFTKEIDKALLDGSIDMAVHSLKDLPEFLTEGLIIAAIPQREDAREALVSKNTISFTNLKKGAVIGTDSTRRKSQILHVRPDLVIKSIRGNVNTRLEKLEKDHYDGIFLAVAGLKRLGLADRISTYFPETEMIPSPGQGVLAVVVKKENRELAYMLKKLNHNETVIATQAERAFSKAFGGGCKSPVGAYAFCKKNVLTIHGFIGSLDGKDIAKDSFNGTISLPEKLGENLAKHLLNESKFWSKQKYIVITRPEKENTVLQFKLEKLGYRVFPFPSIEIKKRKLSKEEKAYFDAIASFDWIIFTSRNGVRSFIEILRELRIRKSLLSKVKIGAVGPKTADEIKKYHLPVHFIPSKFTTENIANELPEVIGKKFFLPRAAIANKKLSQRFKERGAIVANVPIYNTELLTNAMSAFEELLKNQHIQCLMFTSPSTVESFIANNKNSKFQKEIFLLPTLSIGPITTKVLKKNGFKKIYTADVYTIDGMLEKLLENIL